MKYISVRDFQRMIPGILYDELPITITRRGSEVAMIVKPENFNQPKNKKKYEKGLEEGDN